MPSPLFGFQIKRAVLFGEPSTGKACRLLTKPTVSAAALAAALPISDKNERNFYLELERHRTDTEFVRADRADAAAVAALERRCFSRAWTEHELITAMSQDTFSVFALKQGGSIVAYAAVYHTPDELEILNIAVAPEHRRQGLGGRLLGLVLREAAKMGILRSVLEVRPGNAPAIALYAAHGYTRIGRRKGYYSDTHEDALIYTLNIPESAHRIRTS